MIDSFKDYHPLVNFFYFLFILLVNMFILNPFLQVISLVIGLIYAYILREGKINRRVIIYGLAILIFSPIFNSLFNHKGETILFYMGNGNPITLESILYGLSSGLMFINMITWFSCYNKVMTSDKFLHIFANIIPSLSLIITMILRFVPRYIGRVKDIYNAQKAMGEYEEGENFIGRGKNGLKILSIMVTWALENSIDSSDSMKARGYGSGRRTGFSNYRLTSRDKVLLIIMLLFTGTIFRGLVLGEFEMVFFPSISLKKLHGGNIYLYIIFGLMVLIPIILSLWEEMKWRYLKSKI